MSLPASPATPALHEHHRNRQHHGPPDEHADHLRRSDGGDRREAHVHTLRRSDLVAVALPTISTRLLLNWNTAVTDPAPNEAAIPIRYCLDTQKPAADAGYLASV